MRRPSWRAGVVAAAAAVLAALPSLAAALPGAATAPPDLLARVRASQAVGWSGLSESTGTLALPDVRELSGLPGLLGGTTRARTWWRGPQAYRVDVLTATGEQDVVADAAGTWTWDYDDGRAVRLDGAPVVRLPRAGDLVPPLLGARLARTDGLRASPLPGRRVAGTRTAGLRLVPPPGSPTTVARVDLWAEPGTGLPLRVEVTARGQDRPVLVSELLDVDVAAPPLVRVAFAPPAEAEVQGARAADVAEAIDRAAPYLLPDTLAGQPRRDRVDGLAGGVGTYGDGLATFAVVPLPRDLGRRVLSAVGAVDGRGAVRTPLVNGLVVRDGRRVYLLAGTVPPAVLDSAVAALLADPPAGTHP